MDELTKAILATMQQWPTVALLLFIFLRQTAAHNASVAYYRSRVEYYDTFIAALVEKGYDVKAPDKPAKVIVDANGGTQS